MIFTVTSMIDSPVAGSALQSQTGHRKP